MPISSGFNHVAIITPDLDRSVAFYRDAFEGVLEFEMPEREDHPRMAVVDLGGGAGLNIFEAPADTIIGDRRRQGGRGPIDHYAIAVPDRATLDAMRDRLVSAGAEIGEVQRLGDVWSLFFRDPDGMELEVCASVSDG
jgi:catechol 2,3-dioxygenase-like lactoylglutathione lyase family enzyme